MDYEYIKYNATTTGKCGENLRWYHMNTYLYIEGTGALKKKGKRWDPLIPEITSVLIGPGCTAIGDYAFHNHSNLESIQLPNTLITIGERAFQGCCSLREVDIPDSVTGIGKASFMYCRNLERIRLPRSIREISRETFCGCAGLSSVKIPDSVEKIGDGAFRDCTFLKNVSLSDRLVRMGNNAFGGSKAEFTYHEENVLLQDDKLLRKGTDEAVRYLALGNETVALHCRICGMMHDRPLTIHGTGSFAGAKIAAHKRVSWDHQKPMLRAQIEVNVRSPFCCTVGNTFWAVYEENQFVQARLLSVLEADKYSARIRIEIMKIRGCASFAGAVSGRKKEQLRRQRIYEYSMPDGDAPNPWINRVDENTICIYNTLGGGDINTTDYIYTDGDGIDHWIATEYSDFEGSYTFVGDQILGFAEDRFFRWENGLLLDWKDKVIIDCEKDAKEVIVPEGITRLGWFVFDRCPNLERIAIPDSVFSTYHAFGNCPNLKEIILTGNSKLADSDFPSNVTIIKIP